MGAFLCKCGGECRPGQRDCLECHAAAVRRYRRTERGRMQERARARFRTSFRNGTIQRRGCSWRLPDGTECDLPAKAYHTDYNRPLDVLWLCAEHHRRWQREFSLVALCGSSSDLFPNGRPRTRRRIGDLSKEQLGRWRRQQAQARKLKKTCVEWAVQRWPTGT